MRRSKHNARKCVEYVGTQECHFDSQAEYKYALWLEGERKAGRVDQWVHHPGRLALTGRKGGFLCWIEPDFAVWPVVGKDYTAIVQYHEVKGMATAAWRLKRALFEQEHSAHLYAVIDAGWPDEKNGGPRLFDDRRKNKAAKKRARRSK